MTPTQTAQVLFRPSTPELRFLPEGPYPLAPSRISWVSIQHGATGTNGSLNILDLATGVNDSFSLPGRPGFAFPCADGQRFVVGCERNLGFFTPATGEWSPFGAIVDEDREGTIINDGVAWGKHLVFGTKDLKFATPKAGLYLYRGTDNALIRLRDDQVCSNGKAIRETDEGLELIDIDSPTKKVVAYSLDIEAGTLGEPRTLIDLTDDEAVPDGAILTPDGTSMIISMYNPNPAPWGETRQYSLVDGTLQRVWQTPESPQNTCPQLVQHQGKICLVITTAVEHMPQERQASASNAGSLFIVETDFGNIGHTPFYAG